MKGIAMDCCQHDNIGNHFGSQKADRQLQKYRQSGCNQTTRILLDALIAMGVTEATLLDIGGGIGAIQHELLKAGVGQVTNLEASAAYIEACRSEAFRQGHGERIRHLHGDFAQIGEVPQADIVTLERVICCYPDMERLVSQSCTKAGRLLGLVYPHEAWWVRLGMRYLYNLRFQLSGDPFRIYLHPTREVAKVIEHSGFRCRFYQQVKQWQIFVYERTA